MTTYNHYQEKNREYNYLQLIKSGVGSPLRTLKGSKVSRSKFGVGKFIGNRYYFHKSYADKILSEDLQNWVKDNSSRVPFEFNCLRYSPFTNSVDFVECPDFDSAREPVVGRICRIDKKGRIKISIFYNFIYHHKWTFVLNDYSGFDVEQAWEWSRKWLSVLTEPADGHSIENWITQLNKFEL